VKIGCGVGCATAIAGVSAARSSNAARPLAWRPGSDPREAATLPVRAMMGASIAEPRADDGRGKRSYGSYALMKRLRGDQASRAGELRPDALPEPYVTLSRHTAPSARP
jgi:hypothetical protein